MKFVEDDDHNESFEKFTKKKAKKPEEWGKIKSWKEKRKNQWREKEAS